METGGICAIVPADQNGFRPHVIGMGILVGDRQVVTCAHVINMALGPSWHESPDAGRVRLCFPFANALCVEGGVDSARWLPPGWSTEGSPSDVAVIQLDDDVPPSVGRARLGQYAVGGKVRAYGFRGRELEDGGWQSHPDGQWAEGSIMGPQPGGRAQFDGLRGTGARVERGFSGAAIYDPVKLAVVGMIVESDRDSASRVAQFIDTATLREVLGPLSSLDQRLPAVQHLDRPAPADGTPPSGTEMHSAGDSLFVGRREVEELFLTYLSPVTRAATLHLLGHGGIGKSTLMKRLLYLAGERGLDTAYVDLGFVRSPLDLLRRLTTSVAGGGYYTFSHYHQAAARYQDIEADLLAHQDVDSRVVFNLSKLPEILSAQDPGSVDAGVSAFDTQAFSSADNVALYQALQPETRDFFLDPLPVMTRAFIDDLGALGQNFVFGLDRTERTPAHIGQWLLNDLLSRLKNVVSVTAGRNDILRAWKLSRRAVRSHELGPLSEADAKLYLQAIGIEDLEEQREIFRSSGGVPLALELAGEIAGTADFGSDGGSVDAYVVDRMIQVFIEEITDWQLKILRRLSILRWFNRELISELRVGDAQAIDEMLANRFMKNMQYGYSVHDSVRDFILRDLRRQEPIVYQSLHAEAAEFYSAKIGPYVERDRYFLEWLYHILSADPENGFQVLRKHFTTASLAIDPSFCEAVIGVARESDVEENLPRLWLKFFEGSISRQRFDFDGAKAIYEKILSDPEIEHDKELKAELLYQQSVALWYVCRFQESVVVATRSIELNGALGKSHFCNRSLGIKGLALDRMGNFREALRAVRRMARQAEADDPVSEGYAFNSIGYFSWHAGDWRASERALVACRNKWIDLKNVIGECYPMGHLGLLYTAVRQYGLAFEVLEQSKQLCEVSGNLEMLSKTLQNLSEYHRRTGGGEKSRSYAEDAIKITIHLKHPYFQADSQRLLAEACLASGDRYAARDALQTGQKVLAGSGATYMLSRLDVLSGVLDLEELLATGKGQPATLIDRMASLARDALGSGFLNVAANANHTALRAMLALDMDGAAEVFCLGVDRAFRYNWYTGMHFIEGVSELLPGSGAARQSVREELAAYDQTRILQLYNDPGAHVIKIFRTTDMSRIRAFPSRG